MKECKNKHGKHNQLDSLDEVDDINEFDLWYVADSWQLAGTLVNRFWQIWHNERVIG